MQRLRQGASPAIVARDIFLSLGHLLEDGFVRGFAWLATMVYRLAGDWRGWRPILIRTTAHVAVIAVAFAAISLSGLKWPTQAGPIAPVPALRAAAGNQSHEVAAKELLVELNGQAGEGPVTSNNGIDGIVLRLAQPHTIMPDRPRLGVFTYTVQPGDTVEAIASSFGLQPSTLSWANSSIEDAPDLLRIGQEVAILPIDGVYHEVAEGDTVASIAEKYKVVTETITTCRYNNLRGADDVLRQGTRLIVPGGEKPYIPKVVTVYDGTVPEGARGTGRFQWPVLGRITQGYWHAHRAIDLGAPIGSAVQAADGGFVSFVGWTDVGYGNLIVIDHANGFATYYAHLSKVYVFKGQAVERGQVIAAVGSTGWSTGPHLHFEIRYYGEPLNPRAHLP